MSELWTRIKRLFSARLVVRAERVQRLGAAGDDILEFQQIFNRKARRYGLRVIETGVYDADTRESVADFQRRALSIGTADGFVGPQTARRLRIKLVED